MKENEVKNIKNDKLEDETILKTKKNTGLHCFMMIAQLHDVSAEPDQIKHVFNIEDDEMTIIQILRAAKEMGMKAKEAQIEYKRLVKLRLPAIIQLKDESFMILAKVDEEKVLVFNTINEKPELIKKTDFEDVWNGKIILFKKNDVKDKEYEFGFKWFIPSIIKYKKAFLEVLVAVFTIQILGLISPIFMQVIIDKVLVHSAMDTLFVLAFALLVSTILETMISIAKNYVFTDATSKIDVILSARIFDHLFKLPLRYFESRRVGDTTARVKEVENIRRFLTGTPLSSIIDVMFIIIYIVVMFFYSSKLSLIIIATIPFYVLLYAVVTPIFRMRLNEKFNYGAEQQSFLVETVSGVHTVKSFALEPKIQEKWEGISAKYTGANFKTSILAGNANALGQLIQRISDIIILCFGAFLVMDRQITVGELIAFRMLSGRVSGPILRLVQLWQDFQQINVSVKRLGDIFSTRTEPVVSASKAPLPPILGRIAFEGVRFRYRPDGPETIRNMSFNIEPGKIVGVVGRSGCGKSTISKLVQRLYIPEGGKVLVDGIDISLADPAWLRRQIGVVLQENILFNGTIRENIAIQKPAASMKDIIKVAKLAGAHDFILELPDGYDTMTGEKGLALSGGQRQRIAIARALLSDPRILIFDEATSALDYESEKIIQNNLKDICSDRTVLIIAHRLSTIKDADVIMVIDKGELVEMGSHRDLMQKQGMYHYLYSMQEGEN